MKNLILSITLLLIIGMVACKKTSDPAPKTVTNTVTNTVHDTIKKTTTVYVHDTTFCIGKADIVSTWYCYKYANNINNPAWKVTFTADSAYWPSLAPYKVTYSSDFGKVNFSNGSLAYNVVINNCDELKITNSSNVSYYLRRLP